MYFLSLSSIVVLVIAILTYDKVTFTLKPFCIPTNIHLPVSFLHDDMIHGFVANLCLKRCRNNKNDIANVDQNILFTMLPTLLYTYCRFTSGIAIGCCMFFWDWIRQFLCINHVSDIQLLILTNWIQNHENWISSVFFYQNYCFVCYHYLEPLYKIDRNRINTETNSKKALLP